MLYHGTRYPTMRRALQFPLTLRPIWMFDDTSPRFQTAGGAGVAADAEAAGQVIDLSEFGNHLTNTGTQRPLHKVAIKNGRNVLRFDGTNDWLTNAAPVGFTGETGFTMALVASRSAAAAFAMMLVTRDSQNELRWDGAGTVPQVIATSTADTANWSGVSSGWHLYLAEFDDATNTLRMDVDGGSGTPNAAVSGTLASNCISLGARPAGSFFFNGDIGAGMVIPRKLTAGELSGLKAYYKDYWALP